MTTGSKHLIQACNIILIIVGFTAVGLAASQFWIVSFNSQWMIDLRLINWIHILAGLVGLYTLSRNHGIVVAKTLYCASIAVAICSTALYCIMLVRIVHLHDGLMQGQLNAHTIQLVICSLMIFVPAIACLAALVAATLLNRIIVVSEPIWPKCSHIENKKYLTHRIGLTVLATIKLFLALCVLAVAIFLEYKHHMTTDKGPSVLITLDHVSALLSVMSAVVDMHSASITKQSGANYKVAIGISVIAAVWCLKSLDIRMYPYYYHEIQIWRGVTVNGTKINGTVDRNYLIFIIDGVLVTLFALLFGLNLLSAIQASKCFQSEYCNEDSVIQKSVSLHSRCLGLLHSIWGMLLMVLIVLGLLDVPWNANYIGADLTWLSILLFSTGVLYIAQSGSHLSIRFLLGFICFTCALEKMCTSINLTYQSATHSAFLNDPQDKFLGRLLLHSTQLMVLFFETLTGLFSIVICGRALKQRCRHAVKYSTCKHTMLLFGNMSYGVVFVGCNVVFTLGYWMFSESLIEIPFFQMGNGLLVFGISILQALSLCFPALLPSVTVLNVVSASVALFMVSYAISNAYILAALLFTVDGFRWVIIEVALILTSCASISCVVSTFCSTLAIVSFLYTVHRRSTISGSTIVLCDENNFGTQRTLVSSELQTPPIRHMEEQSIYWSADENPYYYQTSKRYYDQPYRIDSGFYGYALANPEMFDASQAPMGADGGGRFDSGRYFRTISSSAAQTRIGHIFS